MTGKERVLLAIAHQEADRIPIYDSFWEETAKQYEQASGMSMIELHKKWGFDIFSLSMDNSMRMPASREDLGEWEIVNDRCGYTVKRRKGKALMHYCNHVSNEKNWPDLKKRFILKQNEESRVETESFFLRTAKARPWEQVKRIIPEMAGTCFKLINFYGPFEATWRHYGFENLLIGCLTDIDLINDMFKTVTDLTIEILEFATNNGFSFDGAWMFEDLGCTRGLLISRDIYRNLLFPHHKKIGDYLKMKNIKFFIHSCGDIREIITDFIDAGIDVIQPLQANTSLRLPELKKEFPGVTFFGNVEASKLAKSKEEIEKELRRAILSSKSKGGYIYHSDHSIPPDVSFSNYEFAISIIHELGRY